MATGVESMQAKWDEMFGAREEVVNDETQVNRLKRRVLGKNLPRKTKPVSKKTERGRSLCPKNKIIKS